jgi:acetyl esterase/lipase
MNFGVLFSGICLVAQQPPSAELDIHYGRESESQTLDLYVPATKGFGTIVYTYGGGWHSGSGKSATPIAEKLRALGYGCVLVSHRLFPPRTFPAQAEDLAAAFAWVKAQISNRGGDPQKLVLAGHSSGAHLSLLLATDPRFLAAHKIAIADISAVVGLSTPVDLTRHADGHGYGDVLLSGPGAAVFGRNEALMRDASPIEHVSRGLPATLLAVGEKDFPMLEADARAFARKAAAVGSSVQVVVAPGKDHMGMARGMIDDNDAVLTAVKTFLGRYMERDVR